MYTKDQIRYSLTEAIKRQSFKASMKYLGYPATLSEITGWFNKFVAFEGGDLKIVGLSDDAIVVRQDSPRLRAPRFRARRTPRQYTPRQWVRYTPEQIDRAVTLAVKLGNLTKTCEELGYPKVATLHTWMKKRGLLSHLDWLRKAHWTMNVHVPNAEDERPVTRPNTSETLICSTPDDMKLKPKPKTLDPKVLEALDALSPEQRKVLETAIQNLERDNQDLERDKQDLQRSKDELERSKQDLQLSHDVLEVTNNLLKKELGIDEIKRSDKALVVDALKATYPVKALLSKVGLAESTYYNQKNRRKKKAEKEAVEALIAALAKVFFDESNRTYGYRRLYALLRTLGIVISEKRLRAIMKKYGMIVYVKASAKYSSYKGEQGNAPENMLNRDFSATRPNEKWVTDITEFKVNNEKFYLSLFKDCFDGYIVSWSIGTSPTAELVNSSLRSAIATLKEGERPIVHSDRGIHYQWPEYIQLMESNNLIRSMSKKGCSPDNAACEGLFGTIKTEFFYNHDWTGISGKAFCEALNNYLQWYVHARVKSNLGFLSPTQYRRQLGYL